MSFNLLVHIMVNTGNISPKLILHILPPYTFLAGMVDDTPDEAFAELKTRNLGVWGVAQIAAGTGLAVYAMWVGILQPGFRKVPLKLQVFRAKYS